MPSWKKVILSGSDAALNSLNVSTSLTASGIIYPTADGTSGQVLITDGAGNLSFSPVENTAIIIKNVSGTTIQKGTPCYITGSGTSGNLAGVWPADASNAARMPAGVIAGETLTAGAEGVGLINGYIGNVNTSAFAAGDSIYVAAGGGYTNVRPTGSAILIQKLGNVEKSHASNGSGVINGPNYYNEVPNIQQGFTWVGNSNGVAIPIATSSIQNVISSSFASTSSFLNSTTNAFLQNGNSFGTTALLGTNDNNSLAFETNGSTRMFVSSSGNVGIGTTTPSASLQVENNLFTQVIVKGTETTRAAEILVLNSADKGLNINVTGPTYASGIQNSARISPTGTGMTSVSIGTQRSSATASFVVNTSTNRVGINKETPTEALDVNGNAIITGSLIVSQSIFQYSNNAAITSGSTANIASFNTSSYTAGFFDYVATSGTNARAGSVFTVWNGNNVEYTETSTNDIGNTSNLLLSASVSAGAIRLQGTSLSGSWSVKTLTRMI